MSGSITPVQPSLSEPVPVRRVAFEDIPRRAWDALLAATPAATPFSRWTFHRAWWDAYAATAEPHYLLLPPADDAHIHADGVADVDADGVADVDADEMAEVPRAIIPLMTREAEGSPGSALYMAASYHADYATVLTARRDLPTAVTALMEHLQHIIAGGTRVDLRRLRESDPFLEHVHSAAMEAAEVRGWQVRREREDVCPVVTLARSWDEHLAGLGKHARHEVRRKLRRARRHGALRLRYLPLGAAAAEHLMALHQARWGSAGLFAVDERGERNVAFLRRLVELEAAEGPAAQLHIAEVSVGEHPLYVLAGFAADGTCYFYNAGLDTASLELSPGVVGTAVYMRDRIEAGDERFDFLRGAEAYKYEWGAADEGVYRVVIDGVAVE